MILYEITVYEMCLKNPLGGTVPSEMLGIGYPRNLRLSQHSPLSPCRSAFRLQYPCSPGR